MTLISSCKLTRIILTLLLLIALSPALTYAGPTASISGTVTDASDAPLPGVAVSVRNFSGDYVGLTATTDASGNYSVGNLASGLYYVQFTKEGMFTAWNGGATSQQTALPLSLSAPDAATGVNAKLGSGASISGTVTDGNSLPLPNVMVILYNSSGNSLANIYTDATGNYSIVGLASGTYHLRFIASGMPQIWYGGAADQQTATPIAVTAPQAVAGKNVQMGVGGSISGTVTNVNNLPLSDVLVTLHDTPASFFELAYSRTDASGNYTIRGLTSGTYYIKFEPPSSGMPPVWYDSASSSQSATPVSIVSPNATIGINGRLGIGGGISGTVTNTSGTPLPGVQVTLYDSNKNYYLFTSTGASGNYSFSGLPSATYYMEFSTLGFPETWYAGAASLQTATPITVTASETTSGINGQLGFAGGGSVSGTVTDAAGLPLYGVNVSLYDASGNTYFGGASTDSGGNYTIGGLASGTYYLQFYPSTTGMPSLWYGGAATLKAATPISVTSPNATTGINGQLGVGGSIGGIVTNPASIPLAGTYVTLYDSAGNYFLGISTSPAGTYQFSGLPSGMYLIQFSAAGIPPVWYGGTTEQIKSTPIIVTAPNAVTGINAILLSGGSIRGTVTDQANMAFLNAQVGLYDSAGKSVYSAVVDGYGNYLIWGLADGTYHVKFSASGKQPVWYGGVSTRQASTPVTIAAANALTGINGQLGVGGSITGTVHSAMNGDIFSMEVRLYNAAGELITTGRANSSGYYSFNGLASGTYYVQFSLFFGQHAIWYGGATRQTATPVIVTAPDATSGIDVTYGAGSDHWIDCEVNGNGSGTVTSSPVGISCLKDNDADCSVAFASPQMVNLGATAGSTAVFSGWSGDCTGLSACVLNMDVNHYVFAAFSEAPKARIIDTGYLSLGFAYAAAGATAEIHALDTVLTEDVLLADGKTITLKGGYNADYISRSGNQTILSGSLKIQKGRLNVDGLIIR